MNSPDEILEKAKKYCAYSERSRRDVVRKLFSWNVPEDGHEEIIRKLYDENYLSDARFIKLFVRSKINQNRWGKLKIIAELFKHGYGEGEIEKYFTVDEIEHMSQNIEYLINKKTGIISEKNDPDFFEKLKKFLFNKGYEPEMISRHLKF